MTSTAQILTLLVDKVCNTCGEGKALSEFRYLNTGCTSKKCKSCFGVSERARQKRIWKERPEYRANHSANMKKYWAENPDKRRTKDRPDRLKRKYGIESYSEVLKTFEDQMGKCANLACGLDVSLDVKGGKGRAVIDHNHKTGKFRALLCNQCNLELGKIEKDINKFIGLFSYLKHHTNSK